MAKAKPPVKAAKGKAKAKDTQQTCKETGMHVATKFPTRESRQALFKEIIAHVEQGLDQASFGPCDWDTVVRYVRDFPEDFPEDVLKQAQRRGRAVIEKILFSNALGKTKGNAASAIFLAKNKLGYRDRVHLEHSGQDGGAIPVVFVDDVPKPKPKPNSNG